MNYFGSERHFDYHLLHRYASLFNVSSMDHDVYYHVLHRLVDREGRLQPRRVRIKVPKLGIPIPLLSGATIGAHTRTSKYILKNDLNLLALLTQISGDDFKLKKYTDIQCSRQLVADMWDIIRVYFGSSFEADLGCDIGVGRLLELVVQQINYAVIPEESICFEIKDNKFNYCVPRPANPVNRFLISDISAGPNVRYFGHNFAYMPSYDGDIAEVKLPPIKNKILKYEDDIRSLKRNPAFGLAKINDKILVPLFPFGDTGYSEIESNHFYQINLLKKLKEILYSYKKNIIFCLHPGTKSYEEVTKILHGFRLEIGVFDRYLPEAKLVICTYRGSTCLGTSIANGLATILLKNKMANRVSNYNNLSICTIDDLSCEIRRLK